LYKIVLLRHGESEWNKENRFTGWRDVDLTRQGISEAKSAGKLFKDRNFKFDLTFTSLLKRANKTLEICLKEMGTPKTPIEYSWRLNERHYGALQSLNKAETALKYGEQQVLKWRRSYNISPPPLNKNDPQHPRFDKKYSHLNKKDLPNCESLQDTELRFMPLWNKKIKPNIHLNKKILIVAHGNSLRALVKNLDNISNNDILKLNIPTGIPLIHELDKNLTSIKNYYLSNN
jgi:2,3-bisphosphoglycerate-dependent phosphoglycerate mutase